MKVGLALLGSVACIALVASGATGANGRSALPGSVPSWAKASNLKSATSSSADVGFRVYLSLRNQAQAEALTRAVSDPSSASYGKYLSPGQFLSQFAPSQADVAAVKSWLQSQGFSIVGVPANNHYVS